MKKLSIVTIGTWGHLDAVLKEIEGMTDVQVVGVAKGLPEDDLAPLRRQRILAEAQAFDEPRPMLEQLHPDVAIISTRLDRIAPLAIEAASAGCHLICEKPLAIDHASLQKLYDAVKANGVQCVAMLDNRARPALLAARQVVRQGTIGKVVLANARKSYKWGQRPEWFGKRSIYGGTIPWIGIHALDFIHAATDLTFTSVAAMQSNLAHPDRPECEDNCALVLSLSNGAHASISIDFLRPQAAPTHGDDWLRIVGSRGVVEAYLARNTCTLITETEAPQDLPLPPSSGFFRPFLLGLSAGKGRPNPETVRSFVLTHAALCARDAADQGKLLSIDPFAA